MPVIDPKSLPERELYQLLVGLVAPRPIAFVSTTDVAGVPNLAPYSFFNVFSSNPPIVVFSSNRTPTGAARKDTLANVEATGEVVINMVNHGIAGQMTITSIAYPPEVNEFEKAGLTPLPADLVRPFRVKESPAQLECKVQKIIPLGDGPGAGNLVICEVVRIHLNKHILDESGRISPEKTDLMGRLGRTFYVRASGDAVYSMFQPTDRIGIGFDRLPPSALHSKILTGNELAKIAGMQELPSAEEIEAGEKLLKVSDFRKNEDPVDKLHNMAKSALEMDNTQLAAICILVGEKIKNQSSG